MKRVVVTGVGLLTSIGNNAEDTWKNLINLKSGIKKITHFDTDGLSCKIAGHISHDEDDPFYYTLSCSNLCCESKVVCLQMLVRKQQKRS